MTHLPKKICLYIVITYTYMGHCTKQEKNYNYFHIYANEILYPFIMSKTSLFMITDLHPDTKHI